jgi:hypothetical protein
MGFATSREETKRRIGPLGVRGKTPYLLFEKMLNHRNVRFAGTLEAMRVFRGG